MAHARTTSVHFMRDTRVMLSATVISPPPTVRKFTNCIDGDTSQTSRVSCLLFPLGQKKLDGSLSTEETILSPHFTFDSHFNSVSPDGIAASTLTQNATLRGVCCHGYLQFAAELPVTRIQLLRAPTITVNFCIAVEHVTRVMINCL